MAIEFKNHLDINQNQLLDAVIELQDTDVNAGTGTQGQLYFNTTDQVLKVWNTTGGASWKSISGDITEVTSTTTSQLVVTNGTGPVASLAIQLGAIANGNLNLVTSDVIYDYTISHLEILQEWFPTLWNECPIEQEYFEGYRCQTEGIGNSNYVAFSRPTPSNYPLWID